ncbi:CPBP family glutamic-type intramembrane protease [Enterococcus hulanensis]|uniref:CPBP family glutamic-type intramembrane protease n=1 Tax=Enterococcus hulanensis TaxID=2559929 RepID=UPI0024B5D986|nr:CPBP family intramembrane glutamic endopeptidase [Enterococcus hulanensis]
MLSLFHYQYRKNSILIMGLVFALAYYKTGRLEVSIMVHFFNNAIGAIAMILMQ